LLAVTRLAGPIMGEPSHVADVIAGAVTSRNPRSRYLVGHDAQAFAALQSIVPTRIKDGVTRFILGL
jgi:hypothetical protein